MSGYRELQIYERSYKAAVATRRITEKLPRSEQYGISDQMNRASLSIPLNVAEGYTKRESQAEFKRFLNMAMGSSNEMMVLIEFAKDIGYIDKEVYEKAEAEYEEISKMLNKFIQKLK